MSEYCHNCKRLQDELDAKDELLFAYEQTRAPMNPVHKRLLERIAELEAVLPDPDRLNLLADWLDVKEASDPDAGVEVQLDLRRWARNAAEALAQKGEMR